MRILSARSTKVRRKKSAQQKNENKENVFVFSAEGAGRRGARPREI